MIVIAVPSLPEDTTILDRDFVPRTSYATPCIHHMRYNEIKTRYIHNNVHISTEVSCRGIFQYKYQ